MPSSEHVVEIELGYDATTVRLALDLAHILIYTLDGKDTVAQKR